MDTLACISGGVAIAWLVYKTGLLKGLVRAAIALYFIGWECCICGRRDLKRNLCWEPLSRCGMFDTDGRGYFHEECYSQLCLHPDRFTGNQLEIALDINQTRRKKIEKRIQTLLELNKQLSTRLETL